LTELENLLLDILKKSDKSLTLKEILTDLGEENAQPVITAQKLVEAGFDYVCDFGELKLFKKRK
jgi:hypothetical protein